jgi:hypothetical protein
MGVFIGFEELSYEIPEAVHIGGLGHLSRSFHTHYPFRLVPGTRRGVVGGTASR